eukprot:4825967-Alexandrium_andersonii.AAC.1
MVQRGKASIPAHHREALIWLQTRYEAYTKFVVTFQAVLVSIVRASAGRPSAGQEQQQPPPRRS